MTKTILELNSDDFNKYDLSNISDEEQEQMMEVFYELANEDTYIMERFWNILDEVANIFNLKKSVAVRIAESAENASPRYALCNVAVKYNGEPELMDVIICIGKEDAENDDRIFYTVENTDRLTELTESDNGEDFFIHDFYGFYNDISDIPTTC